MKRIDALDRLAAHVETGAALPVIDLAYLDKPGPARDAMIAHLRDILHRHGFFYLSGHGVDPELIARTIRAAKEFFWLPLERKQEINIVNSPHFRGYTGAGGEITGGQQDWREQVDFDCEEDRQASDAGTAAWRRCMGPNQWPAGLPGFRETILAYQAEVTRVGINVLRAIALALGQDEDFFEAMYSPRPRQHLKIIRYPGRELTSSDQGVGAHKDGGLVTILLQREREGLRVRNHDGAWVDVPPLAGTFIVNTGELLELATDGFVCADIHAATTPPPGTMRSSIAFFLGANLESEVPTMNLPAELKRAQRGVSADPANPMLRSVGENHLKARIRSHPDVAKAHYPDILAG